MAGLHPRTRSPSTRRSARARVTSSCCCPTTGRRGRRWPSAELSPRPVPTTDRAARPGARALRPAPAAGHVRRHRQLREPGRVAGHRQPRHGSPAASFNVADPQLGGHVAWMTPGAHRPAPAGSMLSEAVEPQSYTPWLAAGTPIRWAIGFADDRAAQLTGLEWVDGPGGDPAQRFEQVDVAISTESALGPWLELGTWTLAAPRTAASPRSAFPEPTWARFVRFTADAPGGDRLPGVPHHAPGPRAAHRRRRTAPSWVPGAAASRTAIREHLEPADPSALELAVRSRRRQRHPDDGDAAGRRTCPWTARIRRGQDVDWYTLTVPATDNVLELRLGARPDAGIVVTRRTRTARRVELESAPAATPGVVGLPRRDVEPGATVPGARGAAAALHGVHLRHERQHGRVPVVRDGGAARLRGGHHPGRGGRAGACPSRTRRCSTTGATTPYAIEAAIAGAVAAAAARAPRRRR